MEIVTLKEFKELESKIDLILNFISSLSTRSDNSEDYLLDNNQVCDYLKISTRTLQRLRTAQQISYRIVKGSSRYSITDLKKAIDNGYIKTKQEYFNNLLESHKRYVEQRNNPKQDK